jgi:hypothetical protein
MAPVCTAQSLESHKKATIAEGADPVNFCKVLMAEREGF